MRKMPMFSHAHEGDVMMDVSRPKISNFPILSSQMTAILGSFMRKSLDIVLELTSLHIEKLTTPAALKLFRSSTTSDRIKTTKYQRDTTMFLSFSLALIAEKYTMLHSD